MFDVSTMTLRRKSTTRPWRSVSRPSSKTCRKRSQTGWSGLLELVEQDDGEGVLAHRGDQRRAVRVGSGVGRAGARATPASGTRSCRGARAGRPSRTGTPRAPSRSPSCRCRSARRRGTRRAGRVGSVTPALTMAMRSTIAVDRLGLPEDALLEERAHLVERQRAARVEQRERKARARGERGEHVRARRSSSAPCSAASAAAACTSRSMLPGRRDAGQELLRELERLGERLVVGSTPSASCSSACRATATVSRSPSGRTRMISKALATRGRAARVARPRPASPRRRA